jgi:hypothetical protein
MGIDTSAISADEETAFLTLIARAINTGWARHNLPDPGAVDALT